MKYSSNLIIHHISRLPWHLTQWLLFIIFVTMASYSFAQESITDIRFWHAPNKTRMVIDLTQGVGYKVFSLDNPNRLVIDLKNAKSLSKKTPEISTKLVKGVRIATRNTKDTRIVIDLRHQLKMEHFALGPQKPYGHRVVVDMFVPQAILPEEDPVIAIIQKRLYEQKNKDKITEQAKKIPEEISPVEPKNSSTTKISPHTQKKPVKASIIVSRDVIVAVDAGHGGEDPGAIGPRKTQEKHIVLSIAKMLQQDLQKQPGVTAVLTRKGDYFVPLADRVKLSNQKYHADFFVSIHADAAGRSSARGASVYVLGKRGVNRTLSLYLSEQEQAGNALGEQKSAQLTSLNKVLADLSLDGSMSHSVLAAQTILQELSRVTQMHSKKVKHNNFQVLRNPYMPALLVETGFISNRKDEQLLKNKKHQQKLVYSIRRGIVHYFKKQPPPGTYFSTLRDNPITIHTVKRNEFLSTIAKKYNTTVTHIKKANKLKSDTIRIGQKLTVIQGLK